MKIHSKQIYGIVSACLVLIFMLSSCGESITIIQSTVTPTETVEAEGSVTPVESITPVESVSPEETQANYEIAKLLAERYLASLYKYDYRSHFEFFHQDTIQHWLFDPLAKRGYTLESALEKIESTVDSFWYNDVNVNCEIQLAVDAPESFENFKKNFRDDFEKGGLSVDDVDKIIQVYIVDSVIYFDGMFSFDEIVIDEVEFFRYKGEWYPSPNYVENDTSIDMLSDSFLEYDTIDGIITGYENGYVEIDEDNYFFVNDQSVAESIGEHIVVTYYTTTYNEMKKISGGNKVKCNVGIAYEFLIALPEGD